VITNVVLSTTTPPEGGFVEVEVTIENQGAYPAEDYELVLIPHYGWGPPNPAGYVTLPDLLPGVPHTEIFSPGVLYSQAGTYTLRVLVTDDWYALGDPDSTGTNGDYQDHTITVLPTMSFCNPFAEMELSVVFLKIRPDTMSQPMYFKSADAIFPGLMPDGDTEAAEYQVQVGAAEPVPCGPQGFDDRLYCTLFITPDMPGTAQNVLLFKKGCDDEVYELTKMTIPELPPEEESPVCKENLSKEACQAAGGNMSTGLTRAPYCICP
jgi:hypothetical protein